jgi:hypothetical protein
MTRSACALGGGQGLRAPSARGFKRWRPSDEPALRHQRECDGASASMSIAFSTPLADPKWEPVSNGAHRGHLAMSEIGDDDR